MNLQNFKPRSKQAGFLQFLPLIGGALGLLGSRKQPKEQTTTQGGSSYGTQTSSTTLPGQITNPATYALSQAGQLYGQGQNVAPLSPLVSTAANRLVAPTSSEFASGATINPHLDTVFNTAADATQNRTASEFARAGLLNSPAHQQSRSQQLQTLAAGVYGPGFEAERQRQYGAAESGLNRSIASIPGLLNTGAVQQQQQQATMDSPFTALNQYIAQLGALSPFFPGSTTQTQTTDQTGNVTQPLYNNPLSAFAGGAVLGDYLRGVFPPKQQPQVTGWVPDQYGQFGPWALS